MVRFSERIGAVPPKPLQVASLDKETRNLLWNIVEICFYNQANTYDMYNNKLILKIQTEFLKEIRSKCYDGYNGIALIRERFFRADWHQIYDLMEFISLFMENNEFIVQINSVLINERCGYRFVANVLAPIFDEVDVSVLEQVSALSDVFAGARAHVKAAVGFHSNRRGPDYRQAVREAITAVEAAAKVACGSESADLKRALASASKSVSLHPAFVQAFEKLYAWTNDEKGIRHALLDDAAVVDEATSYFMIVACSAFVGYLAQKSETGRVASSREV